MAFNQVAGPVIEGVSSRLETGSSNKQDDWNKATASQAILAATGLAGCFRSVDASDAERFIGAIAAVLQTFAPDIIQYVCDPRTGLPGKMKWMPSVAEVREACIERVAEKAKHQRFKNWGNIGDDDRERAKDQGLLPPPPREERPTLAEIKAKHGDNWGIGGPEPSPAQLREYIMTLPPGTRTTHKALIEGWRASKGLTADSPPPPQQSGPRVMTKEEFIAHPALGETLRCFAKTLPDGSQWTMAELCAKWHESQGREERVDPEAERARGPATPLVDANGDTFDGGADF